MTRRDDFAGLARYYDQIMDHVDYYRWHSVAMGLAELLPEPVVHLDAACGTGTFADMMRLAGHQSLGVDLSPGMLKVARRKRPLLPVAQADLRHLPFSGSIGLMTCLFDSVNFLLSIDDVRAMFEQCFAAMASPALLYFDVVTERMVLDHFAGQQWEEDNGEFSTRWSSEFEQGESTSQTHIQVNNGPVNTIQERVYPPALLEQAIRDTGFDILETRDAETLNKPRAKSVRVDYVAGKGFSRRQVNQVGKCFDHVRRLLK